MLSECFQRVLEVWTDDTSALRGSNARCRESNLLRIESIQFLRPIQLDMSHVFCRESDFHAFVLVLRSVRHCDAAKRSGSPPFRFSVGVDEISSMRCIPTCIVVDIANLYA